MKVNIALFGTAVLLVWFVFFDWTTWYHDDGDPSAAPVVEQSTMHLNNGPTKFASHMFNLTSIMRLGRRNIGSRKDDLHDLMGAVEGVVESVVEATSDGENNKVLLESLKQLELELHNAGKKNRTGIMNWLKQGKRLRSSGNGAAVTSNGAVTAASPRTAVSAALPDARETIVTTETRGKKKTTHDDDVTHQLKPKARKKRHHRASRVKEATAAEKVTETEAESLDIPGTAGSISSATIVTKVKETTATTVVQQRGCPYDFKVYVYDAPQNLPSIQLAQEARRNLTLHVCQKCILEQFALEYIITDFFTNFCGRTHDPATADFFYLPIIRDAEYRLTLDSRSRTKRQPSSTEVALLDIMEKGKSSKWMQVFNITDKYWRAKSGADHIVVMPAPVTNFRHETSMRGFFHYMPHLHTPIFLGVEYSSSFVKEYPVCSSQKNIVMPYPTTDPDLFNGKLWADPIPRTALLFYAGGMHGDCVEVRRAMRDLLRNSTHLAHVLPDVKAVMTEREHGFRAATFCPVPVGDSPSSKRMYDVLHFGCIPVVLSDDLVWAYTRQTGGPLDHTSFSLQLPQATVQLPAEMLLARYKDDRASFGTLPTGELMYDLLETAHNEGGGWENGRLVNALVMILRKVPKKAIEVLEEGVAEAAPKYRYFGMDPSMKTIPTATHTLPTGGAMTMLALLLSQRKAVGVEKIRDLCQTEKLREDHQYIAHYPCEATVRRRLTRAIALPSGISRRGAAPR